jgi:hypothetical protein
MIGTINLSVSYIYLNETTLYLYNCGGCNSSTSYYGIIYEVAIFDFYVYMGSTDFVNFLTTMTMHRYSNLLFFIALKDIDDGDLEFIDEVNL